MRIKRVCNHNKAVEEALCRLTNDYGFDNPGGAVSLAIRIYEWLMRMRAQDRLVGAFTERTNLFEPLEKDYRSAMLFASGEYQYTLDLSADSWEEIQVTMDAVAAIDLNTFLSESILFLGDVTELLKGSQGAKCIIALDPIRGNFIELIRPEFKRLVPA